MACAWACAASRPPLARDADRSPRAQASFGKKRKQMEDWRKGRTTIRPRCGTSFEEEDETADANGEKELKVMSVSALGTLFEVSSKKVATGDLTKKQKL